MITVRANIDLVGAALGKKLAVLSNPKTILRPIAFDMAAIVTERIHEKGQAADESQIGTYSPGYMKLRTGDYGNAKKGKSGKMAGKVTDPGAFTRGKKKGQQRPRYNRSSDTKIIVSLTRQLENDWSVIETTKGWGIGFKNPLNAQKIKWVSENKKKKIAGLTPGELEYAKNRINTEIKKQLTE